MYRNVVLISTDQWRGDALSIEGHPVVRTPYLDALARGGVRARHAYSAAPTCVPARMTMMTGLSPQRHGRVGYQDGIAFDVEDTLPSAFRKVGYQTQAIGKMHYWPERVRIGFDNVILHDGYLHHSRVRNRPVEEYDDYLVWLRDQAGQTAVSDYLDNGLHCNSVVARPWDKPEHLHPTTWVVTEAQQWLYRRDPTVPFFLYLSFHRPHAPFDPPQWAFDQCLDLLDNGPLPVPIGDWVEHWEQYRDDARPDAHVAHYPPDVQRRAQAGYFGHLVHIDQQVSRFLQILGEFGLARDTLVCFTSDHGEMLGDHHMWRKGYPYEGSSRIPFVLNGPDIAPGEVIDEVIELRDLMPTLLDWAHVPIPDGLDGRSILPLLTDTDSKTSWRTELHGEHAMLGQSFHWIRTDRYKYVWHSGTGVQELFDLDADPQELRNLVEEESLSHLVSDLRGRLIRYLHDREEGFVCADGCLKPGQPVRTSLSHAGAHPVGVPHPAPVYREPAP